jgi:hypothetical protein
MVLRSAIAARRVDDAGVTELDETGRPIMGWCFVPRDNLASGGIMLAEKIALETNELGALKIARSFPRWRTDA